MDRLRNAALLCQLIGKLREKGSWCGETHIQKAVFLLQEMMDVPMEFDFILYKHGPFSFDLRDDLTALRADEFIEFEPMGSFGPKIALTLHGDNFKIRYPKTLGKYEKEINFVAEKLGSKGVLELEKLATAYYVTKFSGISSDERPKELNMVKPHISISEAQASVGEIDCIIAESKNLS